MANKASKAQKGQKGPDFFSKVAKLKKSAKIGILFGAIAVICAAFYVLRYMPWEEAVTTLAGEVAELDSQVKEEQAILKLHKPISEFVQPVMDTYGVLKNFLTNENEIPQLIQIISDLGAQAGARVTLFAPKAAIPRFNYAEIEFTMNLEGTYNSVLKFFYSLSQMNRLINIRSVTMDTPKMTDTNVMVLSIKCEGSTYRVLTPEEKAAAAESTDKNKKKK
ncbi:MAG: type 4a pilus biogenesis protein PilO [Deltaproteobacteria bacterium]|jgi:Tfp pilus assembly protein PilO|nr:type 4a pilus biogenesis protein PilO [Deltaproteobacteria bacterium]